MHDDERPTLVQHWILVSDERYGERLEARWVLETGLGSTPIHQAA